MGTPSLALGNHHEKRAIDVITSAPRDDYHEYPKVIGEACAGRVVTQITKSLAW
jgi:hypothetical protein